MLEYVVKKIFKKYLKIKKYMYLYILKTHGANIGKKTHVFGSFTVLEPQNLTLKENVSINQGVLFNCRTNITVGNNTHISAYVQIHTGFIDMKDKNKTHKQRPITIENNCWISSGVIIGAGVTIGENSIIGANSVVLKDVDKNSFYAGIPAKKIRTIKYEK